MVAFAFILFSTQSPPILTLETMAIRIKLQFPITLDAFSLICITLFTVIADILARLALIFIVLVDDLVTRARTIGIQGPSLLACDACSLSLITLRTAPMNTLARLTLRIPKFLIDC